jgi:hypothetical protein
MHVNTTGCFPGEQDDGVAFALHNLQALAKRNATGYDLERDHEEALRDAAALNAAGKHTAKDQPCPDCGWPVINWWSGNQLDPGDVDPRADCSNPDCGWGY